MFSDIRDRLAPAKELTTTSIDGAVRLRNPHKSERKALRLPYRTVHTVLADACKRHAKRIAFQLSDSETPSEITRQWTFADYYAEACQVAKSLIALGVDARTGVGVYGQNAPQWLLASAGAILADCVSVGVYPSSLPHECQYILESCGTQVVVVDGEEQLENVLEIRDKLPALKVIVQYGGLVEKGSHKDRRFDGIYSWEEFLHWGDKMDDRALRARIAAQGGFMHKSGGGHGPTSYATINVLDFLHAFLAMLSLELVKNNNNNNNTNNELRTFIQAPNKCCTIIYTSGTTGKSKGVMLSHDNMVFTGAAAADKINVREDRAHQFVSFIPLSHTSGQTVEVMAPLLTGAALHFYRGEAAAKTNLLDRIRLTRPTVFFGSPAIWEVLRKVAMGAEARMSGDQQQTYQSAKESTLRHWLDHERAPKNDNLSAGVTERALQPVKAALGLDRVESCLTGAAFFAPETLNYFLSLNIPVFEGYGASECGGMSIGQEPALPEKSNVGSPIDGAALRLLRADQQAPLDDGEAKAHGLRGEVVAYSRSVFMGYLGEERKTAETIDDNGWLHTGDIGRFDIDGRLFLSGRIKETIVTTNGHNTVPYNFEQAMEQRLHLLLGHCVLVGEGRPYLVALLGIACLPNANDQGRCTLLSPGAKIFVSKVTGRHDIDTLSEAQESPHLKAVIDGALKAVNAAVARTHQEVVRRCGITDEGFSLDGGELTPTAKIRRKPIESKYKAIVERLYSEE